MGQFQTGQSRIPESGRKRGTPNKKTEELFDALNALKFNVPERPVELLPQLPVDTQAEVLTHLLAYLYTKRKAVEVMNSSLPSTSGCVVILPDNSRDRIETYPRVILPSKE